MHLAIAGSIATDHLMTYPGRFADSLVPDKLHTVSLSFLVDDLQLRRGGVGANIAFGLGCLGLAPSLVGAAGSDFAEYAAWLESHGVDCGSVRVSETRHTARFVCTTDVEQNQIAAFYPGAMSEAASVRFADVAQRRGGLDLVLIGADDIEAMLVHTDECRREGYAFAADPSQQLARLEGADIRRLVEGARYLFGNEYEAALLEQKTGWSAADVLERVDVRVTTRGADGATVEQRGHPAVRISVVPERRRTDPTGVGDGFRAGYLAGIGWGLEPLRCGQVGSLLATYVLETVGPQEYVLDPGELLDRFAGAYGEEAAADVAGHLSALPRAGTATVPVPAGVPAS
jgi:adenosine kinase